MDAKTLKAIVKPRLVEDAYLNQYLLSRGINPKYVTKNQLVSHSKTTSYLQWKRDHAHMVVKETMMDPSAPTQSATDGGNSSDDIEPQPVNKKGLSKAAILVKSIHKKNASFGEETEVKKKPIYTHEVVHSKSGAVTGKYQSRNAAHRGADKKDNEYGGYAHHVREIPSVKTEEVEQIDELDQKTLSSYIRKTAFVKSREAGHDKAKSIYFGRAEKKLKDRRAAAATVKEELYDTEKEDKPAATSKKTTFQKPSAESQTKETPQAAAVLSGGKTLTGTPRDVIEIDPMMKMRKNLPGSQKSV
jgi:hypothetical protein